MEVKRVFEGLTVVTVGVILLANTLGVLPWTVWWTVVMLWPLLIVSLGIDILGRAVNSTALRALASLVVIAGLVYGALAGGGRVQPPVFGIAPQHAESFSFLRRHDAAVRTGTARVDAGLTRVTLGGGDALAAATGETPFGKPAFKAAVSGSTADVRIASAEERSVTVSSGARRSFLDVALDREVAWSTLTVDAGLSEVALDLSRLDVAELTANVGLSSAVVTLPERGVGTRATVNGGLSSIKLRVPRSAGVELRADNGLGSVKVPSGWVRVSGDGVFSGVWHSDGYDSSEVKLPLTVKAGLSGVEVERY